MVQAGRNTVTELEKLLAAEPCSGAGVILRLAWRAGLMRDEIYALQWKQVDFERALLRLPDRDVPMDEDLTRCLRQWQTLCGQYSPYVIVSEHMRTHMLPESISRLARAARSTARADRRAARRPALQLYSPPVRTAGAGRRRCVPLDSPSPPTAADRATKTRAAAPRRKRRPPLPCRTAKKANGNGCKAVLKENRLSPAGLAPWLYCDTGLHMRRSPC